MVWNTRRARTLLFAQFLIAFGLISGAIQFAGQVFGVRFAEPGLVTGLSLAACLAWAIFKAFPRRHAGRAFDYPDISIEIRVGDILESDTDIVVGFCDTFDTDTTDDIVINGASLQGQLLQRTYENDRRRLDDDLARALSEYSPIKVETKTTKPQGKLMRYAIGTVAVIGSPKRRIYCVAYSRMGNDLTARCSIDDFWMSLGKLWTAIGARGQLNAVAVPIMGAELARVYALDRENLLKVIILSFVASSRVRPVCRELTVIIRPDDIETVDMLEMQAFLAAL
ncbi:DUF6430 domain-containing protein [Microbispora hainanensis]|jgi:hypothetical protein|uniref:DUF6430 domain-containing protein n=1 Tax=Microbispora hainanensis TaxID=568844 RepID=A0ABZ1T0Q2_9ACTN|nr:MULTISPECIES: macro domain-containing protein [Microbispora]NJP30254.1 hypothetical protein [Microbispora sp. CL1-1]TQS02243.1 hypothetical protein FLW53_39900 [Microbispora sp. SCL1-1]